jgi:biopolymer transport protein TolR
MGMSVGGDGKVKSEPNVVPMIDIMLVLLIIFMLIIPQITAGFDSTPPKGINLKPKKEEDQDQVLGIDKKGQYYWNKQLIKNEALGDTVARVYASRDDYNLFIRADRELEYGKIIDAIDIVSRNGVTVAAMISDQSPGTESSVQSDRDAEGKTLIKGG